MDGSSPFLIAAWASAMVEKEVVSSAPPSFFRVQGSGFRVQGSEFRDKGS